MNQKDHELIFGRKVKEADSYYGKAQLDELVIFEEILSASDVNKIYTNYYDDPWLNIGPWLHGKIKWIIIFINSWPEKGAMDPRPLFW